MNVTRRDFLENALRLSLLGTPFGAACSSLLRKSEMSLFSSNLGRYEKDSGVHGVMRWCDGIQSISTARLTNVHSVAVDEQISVAISKDKSDAAVLFGRHLSLLGFLDIPQDYLLSGHGLVSIRKKIIVLSAYAATTDSNKRATSQGYLLVYKIRGLRLVEVLNTGGNWPHEILWSDASHSKILVANGGDNSNISAVDLRDGNEVEILFTTPSSKQRIRHIGKRENMIVGGCLMSGDLEIASYAQMYIFEEKTKPRSLLDNFPFPDERIRDQILSVAVGKSYCVGTVPSSKEVLLCGLNDLELPQLLPFPSGDPTGVVHVHHDQFLINNQLGEVFQLRVGSETLLKRSVGIFGPSGAHLSLGYT